MFFKVYTYKHVGKTNSKIVEYKKELLNCFKNFKYS